MKTFRSRVERLEIAMAPRSDYPSSPDGYVKREIWRRLLGSSIACPEFPIVAEPKTGFVRSVPGSVVRPALASLIRKLTPGAGEEEVRQ